MDEEKKQLQIRLPEDVQKGRYANIVNITTTREEFIFDFGIIHPQQGSGIITDRIFMNPGHAKRMIEVLTRMMRDYEQRHGNVTAAETPSEIGFKTA